MVRILEPLCGACCFTKAVTNTNVFASLELNVFGVPVQARPLDPSAQVPTCLPAEDNTIIHYPEFTPIRRRVPYRKVVLSARK